MNGSLSRATVSADLVAMLVPEVDDDLDFCPPVPTQFHTGGYQINWMPDGTNGFGPDKPCTTCHRLHADYGPKVEEAEDEHGVKMWCHDHKPRGETRLEVMTCQMDGCGRRAAYGFVGDLQPRFCVVHRADHDGKVGEKRVVLITHRKSIFMARHKFELVQIDFF